MKSRLLDAVCGCLLALVTTLSNAAQVNYLIEGDAYLFSGTDDYSLDGAHFLWAITADTASTPVSISADANGSLIAFYEPLSSQIAITNRSNSAPDAIATGTIPLLRTTNASIGSGWTDTFEPGFSYLDGEFSGLVTGGYHLDFANDFYFEFGFAPLPVNFDFTEAIASGWGIGFDSVSIGPPKYAISSWSMSVQPVPIPPAVWLFGSGLLGLVGVAKRKRA